MSLEATIKTLLGPLVGGRCYPDVTPDGAAFPLIVYQQVGGRAIEYTDQTIPDKDHARMQVMVWSKSRLEASQIARAARAAIIGSGMPTQTYAAPVSLYQEDLKLYGNRTDYGIWLASDASLPPTRISGGDAYSAGFGHISGGSA